MTHEINEDILNSDLRYCIDEYVRVKEHRKILRERWFRGYSIQELSERHHMSETAIKSIVYNIGDKILLHASDMQKDRCKTK